MTQKQNISIGLLTLSLMVGMNFSYALDGYGFLNKNLYQKIWADGTSSSVTTSGYNPPSTELEPGEFVVNREEGTELKDFDPIKETVVVNCLPNGSYACKPYQGYRHKDNQGKWGDWHPI